MIPVPQLVDSPVNGDCLRACVASILEVDPLTLPNVGDKAVTGDRHWLNAMNDALAPRNLALFQTSNGQAFWEFPYFVWSIVSPKYEGVTHSVVVSYDTNRRDGILGGWKVEWDPSPYRDEPGRDVFYAKPIGAIFFVVVDPRRTDKFLGSPAKRGRSHD